MDYLWTPWRYQYMAQVTAGKQPDCIFCDAVALNKDDETLIAFRGAKTFVILNRFPYTSGHVMIVPYAHVAELNLCDAATLSEMMPLAQRMRKSLRNKLQARRHESRHEPRPRRRCRRRRTFASSRPPSLVRRLQFHDRHRRNPRPPRRAPASPINASNPLWPLNDLAVAPVNLFSVASVFSAPSVLNLFLR